MRIAISNIAWDVSEDQVVADLLGRYAVDAIDIAPGKYFPEPGKVHAREIAGTRNWWGKRGIQITGMQALLFGTSGLNLFGTRRVQAAMLRHLGEVFRIAAGVGATRLVFGSPRNRDRSGLTDKEALEVGCYFFQRLGDLAQEYGVVVCLEPNPPCYGSNFMVNSRETAGVVEAVGHRAIRMQLDTGAIAINEEDPLVTIDKFAHLIGHVHASEPALVPPGDGGADHSRVGACLSRIRPDLVVSIEMLATREEPHIDSIERALRVVVRNYRFGDDRGRTAE